jgi:hypothetical protein
MNRYLCAKVFCPLSCFFLATVEQSENIRAISAFEFFRSGFFDPASQRQHCKQARGFHRIRLSVSYLHHKSMTTSS